MLYEIKNFSHLQNIGNISNEAFAMHIKLYEGYVNNTNQILEKLTNKQGGILVGTPEWNELNRRFGWEWNGMRNHELFFESLTSDLTPTAIAESALGDVLSVNFNSFNDWKKDFESICKIRGIGWAMLVQDKKTKQLMNIWVNEHDAGMLSDVNIILNVDMFEHAYVKDFGTNRQSYLDSIFSHINWRVVKSRLLD